MPYPARIGGPARPEAFAGLKAGLDGGNNLGQPGGTERAAPRVRQLAEHARAQLVGDFLDVLGHQQLAPFLALRLARLWGTFQRKGDFEVLVINDKPDGSLPCFTPHPVEEFTKGRHFFAKRLLARVALDDHGVIE
jgi:hypothetical protein